MPFFNYCVCFDWEAAIGMDPQRDHLADNFMRSVNRVYRLHRRPAPYLCYIGGKTIPDMPKLLAFNSAKRNM